VETQVLLAARLGYFRQDQVRHLLAHTAEVGRLITGLSKSLRPRGDAL
jgi:hypothetical protein